MGPRSSGRRHGSPASRRRGEHHAMDLSSTPAIDRAFQKLAEAVPQIVWAAGIDGRCDWVNRRWSEYTGLSAERSIGLGWIEAIHPDHLGQWMQAARSTDPREVEHRIRRADGMYR